MERVLGWLARGVMFGFSLLSLEMAARCGRAFGFLAWVVDKRHRRVALANVEASRDLLGLDIPTKVFVRKHFMRIGENFASGLRGILMEHSEIEKRMEFQGLTELQAHVQEKQPKNLVFAIGHFGAFELYAFCTKALDGYQRMGTYRALKPPSVNAVLQSCRERTGLLYWERRLDAFTLRAALDKGRVALGLLCDQNASDRGVKGTFLRRPASTSTAPAVLAHRYDADLFTVVCHQVDIGRWRFDIEGPIATRDSGERRSVKEIMGDVNRVFETAIIKDPINWFWVHNRWRAIPEAGRERFERRGRNG